MNKVVKIILIVLGVLILIAIIAGIYLYQFYVFKVMRICISTETQDIPISCASKQECIKFFIDNVPEIKNSIDTAPEFAKTKITEILNEAISCETSCKIRKIYGEGFGGNGELVSSCKPGEKELVQEIRGKEGLEILQFIKNHPELNLK